MGANKGQYLNILLKKLQNMDVTIHCFEPARVSYMLLQQNVNSFRHVKLNKLALGKEQGKRTLYYDMPDSGLASFTKRNLEHKAIKFDESETVNVDTIDNYCNMNKVQRIHLLKLDVEGHELDVLLGASEMFKRGAIDIVTFEFGGCNIDTHSMFRDFFYFFEELQMEVSRITPSGYLYKIKTYKEIFEQFRASNFIAIRLPNC